MNNQILVYFTYQTKSAFIPFRSLYPECSVLIDGEPNLHQLFCLKGPCHRSRNCMETLVKRVHYFFTEIEPQSEMIVAYFKHGNSIKAGIFNKNLEEPRLITVNQSGFNKFKNEGEIKQWVITDTFINIGGYYQTPSIIPVENLIRK